MSPKWRRRAAVAGVIACIVLWPVSMFTFAMTEPPVVLSLSWLAILLTCLDIAATTDVRAEQDGKGKDG